MTPNLQRKNSTSNNSSPRTPNLSKSFSKLKTKTPTNNNRTARNYTKDDKGLLLFEKNFEKNNLVDLIKFLFKFQQVVAKIAKLNMIDQI